MIERVARALEASGSWSGNSRDACLILAKAAIEAMREPTDQMLAAGEDDSPAWYGETLNKRPGQAWADMIDAALAEERGRTGVSDKVPGRKY